MKGYCYVYVPDGAYGSKEYGHPEIRIHQIIEEIAADGGKGIFLGKDVLRISAQVDLEQGSPYGIKVGVDAENLATAKKFITALERENPGFNRYRAVLRMLQKKRIPRYINTNSKLVQSERHKNFPNTKWIPFRYRHKADAYVEARANGLPLKH